MKALIEVFALYLAFRLVVRLCRSRNYIHVRVRPRRTSGASVLVGVAVLIVALTAVKT